MSARKRALECGDDDYGRDRHDKTGEDDGQPISTFILDQGFDEVPKEILNPKAWSVVWSRPWQFKANILNTEARALAWSIEHLLRANRCIGKRLLCLCDNMPVVLGCIKGRAKSGHLLRPLRRIAALCWSLAQKLLRGGLFPNSTLQTDPHVLSTHGRLLVLSAGGATSERSLTWGLTLTIPAHLIMMSKHQGKESKKHDFADSWKLQKRPTCRPAWCIWKREVFEPQLWEITRWGWRSSWRGPRDLSSSWTLPPIWTLH